MRVVALIATYNEERFIAGCIEHLMGQGVETYLIDNESTDRMVEIAEGTPRGYPERGLLGLETVPWHLPSSGLHPSRCGKRLRHLPRGAKRNRPQRDPRTGPDHSQTELYGNDGFELRRDYLIGAGLQALKTEAKAPAEGSVFGLRRRTRSAATIPSKMNVSARTDTRPAYYRSITTFLVHDNLGQACVWLGLSPILSTTFGTIGGVLGTSRRPISAA